MNTLVEVKEAKAFRSKFLPGNIKQRVFSGFTNLIDNREESDSLDFFFYVLYWIQFILLPLEIAMTRWNPNSILYFIISQGLAFTFSPSLLLGKVSLFSTDSQTVANAFDTFSIINLCINAVYLMALINFAVICKLRVSNNWIWTVVNTIALITMKMSATILIIPFSASAFINFSMEANFGKNVSMVYFPNVALFSTIFQTINFICAFLLVAPFLIQTLLTQLCFFQFQINTNQILSRRYSTLNFVHQITITVFFLLKFTIFKPESSQIYLLFTCLFIGFLLCYFSLVTNPFHFQLARRFLVLGSLIFTWSSFIGITSLYFTSTPTSTTQDTDLLDLTVIWSIGCILSLMYAIFRNDMPSNILNHWNPNISIKTALYRLSMLQRLIHWSEIHSKMATYFSGSIELHIDSCDSVICSFYTTRKIENETYSDYLNRNKQAVKDFIKETYTSLIVKDSENFSCRFDYMLFQLEQLRNYETVMSDIEILSNMNRGFCQDFVLYYCKVLIEQSSSLESMRLKGSIPEAATTSKLVKVSFENQIEACCEAYANFWNKHISLLPPINEAMISMLEIQKMVSDIKVKWEEIGVILGNGYMKYLVIFAKFLLGVVHDNELGEELIFRAKLLSLLNFEKNADILPKYSKEDINNISLPFVIASTNRNKLGNIVTVNTQLCSQLGYKENELLESNIRVFCPQIFRDQHDSYVLRSLRIGVNKFEKRQRIIYGIDKLSNIVAVTLTAKILGVSDIMVAKLRFQKDFNLTCFLLVNENGIIENVSSSANIFFNRKESLKGLNVNNLVPEQSGRISLDGSLLRNQQSQMKFELSSFNVESHEHKYSEDTPRFFIFKYSKKQQVNKLFEPSRRRINSDQIAKYFTFFIDTNSDRVTSTFRKKFSYTKYLVKPIEQTPSFMVLHRPRTALNDEVVTYKLQGGQILIMKDNNTEENEVIAQLKANTNSIFNESKYTNSKIEERNIVAKCSMSTQMYSGQNSAREMSFKTQIILAGVLLFVFGSILLTIYQSISGGEDISRLRNGVSFSKYFYLISSELQKIQYSLSILSVNCIESLDYFNADNAVEYMQISVNNIIDYEKQILILLPMIGSPVLNQAFIFNTYSIMTSNGESKMNFFQIIRFFVSNCVILFQTEVCKINYINNIFLNQFTNNTMNTYSVGLDEWRNTIESEINRMSGSFHYYMIGLLILISVFFTVYFAMWYSIETDREKFKLVSLVSLLKPTQLRFILSKIDGFLSEMLDSEMKNEDEHPIKKDSEDIVESRRVHDNVNLLYKMRNIFILIPLPLIVGIVIWLITFEMDVKSQEGKNIGSDLRWSLLDFNDNFLVLNSNLIFMLNKTLMIKNLSIDNFLDEGYRQSQQKLSVFFEVFFDTRVSSQDYSDFMNDLFFANLANITTKYAVPVNPPFNDTYLQDVFDIVKNPSVQNLTNTGLINLCASGQKQVFALSELLKSVTNNNELKNYFWNPSCDQPNSTYFCIYNNEFFKTLYKIYIVVIPQIVNIWLHVLEGKFDEGLTPNLNTLKIQGFFILIFVIGIFIGIFLLTNVIRESNHRKSIKSMLGMAVFENLNSLESKEITSPKSFQE